MKEIIISYADRKPGEQDPGFIENRVVRELIRCKDCKYWTCVNESHYGRCSKLHGLTPFDWFCADGEREKDA